MEKFEVYEGTTVPIMNNNIDTDQLIPKQFLKAVDKDSFGKNLFFNWRYLNDDYELNPDFALNNPMYQSASLLVTGDNFGSGSSREHAVWALTGYVFKAVIAGSFSDIFYNNSLKNGLLPITASLSTREALAQLDPHIKLTVDLPNQLVSAGDIQFSFDIDQTEKYKLVNGLDDIGITLQHLDAIKAYEKNRPAYWL